MKRARKVGIYKDVKPFIYKGLDDFLELEIESGIHSFQVNRRMVDILFEERSSDALIVFFPSAVEPNLSFPHFSGRGIAERSGHSLLSFSDPAIAVDANLSTNWTLGDATYQYHRDVPTIIRKIAGSKRIIFIGSSAGGFPALYYGSLFPESVSLVMNPRTGLFTQPTHLQVTSHILFPNMKPQDIAEVVPTRLGKALNTVVYFQNVSEDRYYSSHAIPYFSKQCPSNDVYWKLTEWAEGQALASSTEIVKIVQNLISAPTWGEGALISGARQLNDINDITDEHTSMGYAASAITEDANKLIAAGDLEDRIATLTQEVDYLINENISIKTQLSTVTEKLMSLVSRPDSCQPLVSASQQMPRFILVV